MRTPHSHPVRVYYEDTDFGGIVYYANYLKFIERGRSELLRDLGIDQIALKRDTGLVFVVRRLMADYLAPARFDDLLEVTTELTHLGGASLTMGQSVLRDGATLFKAEVGLVCMTANARPGRVPADIRQRLQAIQR